LAWTSPAGGPFALSGTVFEEERDAQLPFYNRHKIGPHQLSLSCHHTYRYVHSSSPGYATTDNSVRPGFGIHVPQSTTRTLFAPKDTMQISLGRVTSFHTPCRNYSLCPCWIWTLWSYAPSSGAHASYPVFVPQIMRLPHASFTPPSSDAHALRYPSTSIRLRRGLPPPSCHTCSAHIKFPAASYGE
jgi:hypothetical protein